MTASDRRRPVTARDFNRLMFALLLLGALTVFARLITRQDSRAEGIAPDTVTLSQWLQTADALFVRGEWVMAADAYYGAMETAALQDAELEPRIYKKLSVCLLESGDRRGAIHFLRLYRADLLAYQRQPHSNHLPQDDPFRDPNMLAAELQALEQQLIAFEARGD
jgi:hypothetical protein